MRNSQATESKGGGSLTPGCTAAHKDVHQTCTGRRNLWTDTNAAANILEAGISKEGPAHLSRVVSNNSSELPLNIPLPLSPPQKRRCLSLRRSKCEEECGSEPTNAPVGAGALSSNPAQRKNSQSMYCRSLGERLT